MPKLKFHSLFADPYGAPAMIRRLLTEQGFGHWRRYAFAFTLMAVSAGCTASSAYLIGEIVNQAYVKRNFPGILAIGGMTIVLFILKGLSTYGHSIILARIGTRIVAENQRRMFGKLLNESLGFFAERHSSEFTARLTTGAAAASQVLNLMITAIGRDFLSLIGLVTVMVVQDPLMSTVGFLVVPPAMLVLRKMVRRIRAIAKSQFTGGTQLLEAMQETIQGIRIVKAFTLEDEMRRRIDGSVAEIEKAANKWARVANRASPLMETLGGIAIAIAIVYGGYRIAVVGATAGELMSFIAAFLLAFEPAKRLARLNLELHSALVGVRILFELIDSPPTEPMDDDRRPLVLTAARIEMSNVHFAYRKGEPTIREMSFMAEPGRVTALVGPSGGGKSTVLSLLLRYYDIDNGSIVIDGQNVASVSRRSLRQQIGYVGQHVHLFRGTVRENIAFGKSGATESEIIAAAKAAHAHEFITAFPAGYDTPVGEHGLQLSGGQRQRIAIARALIKNAPIILLDEATAALDSESERLVQDAIAHLCKDRTTIVVAHRLHTIMHADRIHVVENGMITESGRHDDLLRKGGRYASFYRLQLHEQAPEAGSAASPRAVVN
ncbi:MAG TPA: ABC transporter ATP-binding protein [Xanthobacteraceae bacterium]|jgi:ATP-binding cassette subfamily B protein|nr:ABC transporter ATP-binding protein [Xanthobacteraceae bacterium]